MDQPEQTALEMLLGHERELATTGTWMPRIVTQIIAKLREEQAAPAVSPDVPRQLKRTCPACFQTYEIKRGHGCPEGRVNVPETDPGIIASDRGYVIDNQPRAYNTQDILHVKSVPCQGTDMTSNMIQPVPSCHRCGQPCVQGNQGSWMCDCGSTPFDMRAAATVEASPDVPQPDRESIKDLAWRINQRWCSNTHAMNLSWMEETIAVFVSRAAAPVEASPSRCEFVDDGDRCTLPKGHEIHQFVFGPDEASPSAPMCWHKEINDEGICKTCGAKAAIKLEGMQPRGTEPVDMRSIQNSATSKEAQEVSVAASPSAGSRTCPHGEPISQYCPECGLVANNPQPTSLESMRADTSPSAGSQEDVKRQLIDYLVENDGEDSIEMLVEGIMRIVRPAASQDVLARTKLEEAEWWHSRHPDFREPCNCLGCQRIAALRDQLSKDKGA